MTQGNNGGGANIWSWVTAFTSPQNGIRPSTTLVLWSLTQCIDWKTWSGEASISRLASLSKLGERSVSRHLTLAEESGWIKRQRRGSRTIYQALVPRAILAVRQNGAANVAGASGQVGTGDAPKRQVPPANLASISSSLHPEVHPSSTAEGGCSSVTPVRDSGSEKARPDYRALAEQIKAAPDEVWAAARLVMEKEDERKGVGHRTEFIWAVLTRWVKAPEDAAHVVRRVRGIAASKRRAAQAEQEAAKRHEQHALDKARQARRAILAAWLQQLNPAQGVTVDRTAQSIAAKAGHPRRWKGYLLEAVDEKLPPPPGWQPPPKPPPARHPRARRAAGGAAASGRRGATNGGARASSPSPLDDRPPEEPLRAAVASARGMDPETLKDAERETAIRKARRGSNRR